MNARPPSFVIKANTDRGLHFSYVRYLENRLREAFGFVGTPIRLSIQKKQKGDEPPQEGAKVRRIMEVGEGLKPSRHPRAQGTKSHEVRRSAPRKRPRKG
jgi:GTP-binding protein